MSVLAVKFYCLFLEISVNFEDVGLGDPKEWVQTQMIDKMQPHLVSFVSAMAGVLVLKLLIRS